MCEKNLYFCGIIISNDKINIFVIADLIAKIKSRGAVVVSNDELEYNPEFVAKVQRGHAAYLNGECVKVDVDNLWS